MKDPKLSNLPAKERESSFVQLSKAAQGCERATFPLCLSTRTHSPF